MNLRRSVFSLMAAGFVNLLALSITACGDSDSLPAAVGVDLSSSSCFANVSESSAALSSSLVATSSSAKVSSSSETVVSSSAKAVSSSSSAESSSAALSSSVNVAESSSAGALSSSAKSEPGSSDDGVCTQCDSYTAADPTLVENGGKGSVTTYGSVTAKETSLGGACNYGQTNIQYYAAIHVNV